MSLHEALGALVAGVSPADDRRRVYGLSARTDVFPYRNADDLELLLTLKTPLASFARTACGTKGVHEGTQYNVPRAIVCLFCDLPTGCEPLSRKGRMRTDDIVRRLDQPAKEGPSDDRAPFGHPCAFRVPS